MAGSLHGEVATAIGQQVEQMILQAKTDSENRVRHDLSYARHELSRMEGIINELTERVARCVRFNGPGAQEPSPTVDRSFLNSKIRQLEEKWHAEVKALKQDLHRTILAHNHNSDLMRHHRDALDEARRKLDSMTQPRADQVDMQIEKVERIVRAGQTKQRALDALTDRLGTLELQVTEMLPGAAAAMGAGAFPGMPPGIPGYPPYGDLAAPVGRAAAKKKASAKDDGKAADWATNFNAEAPVFIPRGASPTAEATSEADIELDEPAHIVPGGGEQVEAEAVEAVEAIAASVEEEEGSMAEKSEEAGEEQAAEEAVEVKGEETVKATTEEEQEEADDAKEG